MCGQVRKLKYKTIKILDKKSGSVWRIRHLCILSFEQTMQIRILSLISVIIFDARGLLVRKESSDVQVTCSDWRVFFLNLILATASILLMIFTNSRRLPNAINCIIVLYFVHYDFNFNAILIPMPSQWWTKHRSETNRTVYLWRIQGILMQMIWYKRCGYPSVCWGLWGLMVLTCHSM